MLLIVEGIGKEGAAHGRTTMQRKRQPPGRTITKSTQARHPPACLYCVARPAMRIRRFSRPQLVPIRQSNGAEPPCDAKDRHQAAAERDTKGKTANLKEQEDPPLVALPHKVCQKVDTATRFPRPLMDKNGWLYRLFDGVTALPHDVCKKSIQPPVFPALVCRKQNDMVVFLVAVVAG